MNKQSIHAGDVLSAREGRATVTINGNVEDLFYAKAVEAKITKKKTEINTLGKRATQHKTVGWSGSGTLTLFYVSSLFRSLLSEYNKTGKDFYFTLTAENDDPGSTVGKQTVILYDCNVDESVLTKFDVDSEVLTEELPFTFSDFEIIDEFSDITTN